MASGAYQYGMSKVLDGTIDLDTTTLKVMALKSSYVYDPDHTAVSSLTEISGVSGYTAGFGGAGRKTATVAISVDNVNNKVIVTFTDLTWTALGTGDTIGGFALVREITNDAGSIPIVFFDVTDLPTNGGDITLDFAAAGANGGNLQLAC
jgi:hypothetical protein